MVDVTVIADTRASRLAGQAWTAGEGIRGALELGLPGDVSLEDVGDWSQTALRGLLAARSPDVFEARLVGVIAAALIVGAKLQETGGA